MKITVKCNNMNCFANRCMHCRVLQEPIETGRACPFFQTDEQVKAGREKALKRLMSMGERGKDLIETYTANAKGYAL